MLTPFLSIKGGAYYALPFECAVSSNDNAFLLPNLREKKLAYP
jgi:hypothetical protein